MEMPPVETKVAQGVDEAEPLLEGFLEKHKNARMFSLISVNHVCDV